MANSIKHWIVYMYTFPNNKRYIGKTCRKLSERQGLNFNGYKRCTLLWGAIQKYGYETIKQEILFDQDAMTKEVCDLEKYYIEFYKTNANKYKNPAFGYNLTAGGDGLTDWKPSPERYKKLCEQLAVIAENRRNKKVSKEARLKMRLAKLGKKYGPMSEEHKRKISIANSRENMSMETHIRRSESKKKKVLVINQETGERTIYNSLEDVSKVFSVKCSAVSRWCKKTRNPSVNYIFEYYVPPTTTEREDLA